MKRLLVTGASGLLGLNLALQTMDRFHVTGVTNSHSLNGAPFAVLNVDLSRPGAFSRLVDQSRPDVVVHCAAQANIDVCENNPAQSMRLNAELPGEIAGVCARRGIALAHISTDAVFDGLRGDYREEDRPNPQSVYSRDKLAGEKAVLSANRQAVVARVNFYGWSLLGKRSLAEFFFYSLSAGKRVNGFTDVLFCPLVVNTLADTLIEMLRKDLCGMYHVFSRESQSKYQFGVAIARQFGLDESLVTPISVADSGLVAKRSPNLTMRVDKLEAALGHAMPTQVEGVSRLHTLYQAGHAAKIKALAG
jgi:dTDP-4-dehydrorhamnose reductase